jgi:uncharacterized protein (DUF433 family)
VRDAWIETVGGVQGGRPVIKGTRLTISAIYGRLSSGDTIEDLVADYPDIPREAFDAAFIYGKTHPRVGRPIGSDRALRDSELKGEFAWRRLLGSRRRS